jgi:hypothetical protein
MVPEGRLRGSATGGSESGLGEPDTACRGSPGWASTNPKTSCDTVVHVSPVVVATIWGFLGGAVWCVGVFLWAIRRARKTYPKWIVSRLRETGVPVELKVRSGRGTWDPTRPSASSRTYESGRATYSLDSSGIVHLSMRSKVGAERHMAGPMPQQLLDSESRRRQRTLTRSLVLGYGVLLLAGFVVGYLLATGSVAGRLLVGLAGAFVGMIVVSLAALMLRVASSVRDLHRGSS